jgi:hypothetical protein
MHFGGANEQLLLIALQTKRAVFGAPEGGLGVIAWNTVNAGLEFPKSAD